MESNQIRAAEPNNTKPMDGEGTGRPVLSKKKADEYIEQLDFTDLKAKLVDGGFGGNWTKERAEHAEKQYRRWLHLCVKYDSIETLSPSVDMDEFWHAHILDTHAYHRDCEAIFGYYRHHNPYFGLRGEDDYRNLLKVAARTDELYLENFGEALVDFDNTAQTAQQE